MLSPPEVFVVFIILIVVIFLVRNQRFHEIADRLAREFCSRHDLQMLDGTVAFRGLHLDRRHWHFCRTFRFDYSINSVDRFRGSVTLCGDQIQTFFVHPDHIRTAKTGMAIGDELEL